MLSLLQCFILCRKVIYAANRKSYSYHVYFTNNCLQPAAAIVCQHQIHDEGKSGRQILREGKKKGKQDSIDVEGRKQVQWEAEVWGKRERKTG